MSQPVEITPETLWPAELLYWRRMSSRDIQEYVQSKDQSQRLILFVWGVIEAHGRLLPVASDSIRSAIAADYVAMKLWREHKLCPIIFDCFQDVGSPSATWAFPGSIGFTSHPVAVLHAIWEQTLRRLLAEGFTKFFVVNGDGGNWQTHWAELNWDPTMRQMLAEHHAIFAGANWDQGGKLPGFHASTVSHAINTWMLNFAPPEIRLSALRHGLPPVDEIRLTEIDGADMTFLEQPPAVHSYWAVYHGQEQLLSTQEFSLKRYRDLLYNTDGSPRAEGGIRDEFYARMDGLYDKVVQALVR